MSGRQAKLARREIRRSAAPGLRTMQEQQEGAIMACIARANELTTEASIQKATIHNLGKQLATVDPAAWQTLRADHDRLAAMLQARDRTLWTRLRGLFTGAQH